jgi:hypothetical protein
MATIQLTPSGSALLSGSVAVVNLADLSGSSAANLTSSGAIARVGDLAGASAANLTSTGAVARGADFVGASALVVSSDASLQAILDVYAASAFVARSSAYLENEQLDVWATTVEGGVSRYEGYNFTSFVTVGGRTFGLNDSGLYELTGTTDAGAPIKWFLQAAPVRNDLGILLPYMSYVVGEVPDNTTLFVQTDAEEVYDYDVPSTEGRFDSARSALGRGLRTRHFSYGVYGKATTPCELSSVTVRTKTSPRNI